MQGVIFMAHSGVRYLVLASGLLATVILLWWISGGRKVDSTARRVVAVYTGLLDLQVLLGLLLLLQTPFYGRLGGHVTMMIAAVVLAHATSGINRRRSIDDQSNTLLLLGVLGSLMLIVGGIMAIGRSIIGSM